MMRRIAILGFAILHSPVSAHALGVGPGCERVRGVVDIGSGTTKLKVARVDTCLQRIIAVLTPEDEAFSRKVSYKAALADSASNELSPAMVEEGVRAVIELKTLALGMGATQLTAIATAAFREAANAAASARAIEASSGVPTRIVSQRQEGLLGYVGAMASDSVSATREQLVVWDIGGASMQMTTFSPAGEATVYEGLMAAEPFKRGIIERVQGRDPRATSTPNPIREKDAIASAALVAGPVSEIPAALRQRLADPRTIVVGIGGVHRQSVLRHVRAARAQGASEPGGCGSECYGLEALDRAVRENLGRTDAQFEPSRYACTEASNLLLVRGFMQALGIREVRTISAGITEGVLVDPAYW